MAKQIAKLLRADISESSNLMEIARMLEKKGRGNDTILAHITKKEAQMLKDAGGSGTVNPDTGLLEFYDGDGGYNLMQYGGGELGGYAQAAGPEYQQSYNQPVYSPEQSVFAGGEYSQAAPAPIDFQTAATSQTALPGYQVTSQPVTQEFPSKFAATPTEAAALTSLPPTPPTAATEMAGAKPEKSWWDKMSDEQKMRLGLAGGLGLFGAYQGRQAAKQAEQRAGEMQALGRPYQTQGAELQRAAMAGELTPQSAQAYQALNARLAQGVEQRGGVGAAQAAAQAEAFRQQLLANQYNLGLQVSNIGDNIAIGAIRTGMQADQQLNQVNAAFATQLGAIAAGLPTRTA